MLAKVDNEIIASRASRGRLDTVTNGRFQVSEFNDSFPAMNLKSGRSPGDPNPPYTFLQSGRMPKYRFLGFASTKQPLVVSGSRPIAATEDADEIFHP